MSKHAKNRQPIPSKSSLPAEGFIRFQQPSAKHKGLPPSSACRLAPASSPVSSSAASSTGHIDPPRQNCPSTVHRRRCRIRPSMHRGRSGRQAVLAALRRRFLADTTVFLEFFLLLTYPHRPHATFSCPATLHLPSRWFGRFSLISA